MKCGLCNIKFDDSDSDWLPFSNKCYILIPNRDQIGQPDFNRSELGLSHKSCATKVGYAATRYTSPSVWILPQQQDVTTTSKL